MKNEKYEFLYDYARQAFQDELERRRTLESKAAKYLSFFSIAILAYSLILRYLSSVFFPPENCLQYLILLIVALAYILMIWAWSLLFRSLKFVDMPRLPLDHSFLDKYEPKSLVTLHYVLTRTCVNGLSSARKENGKQLRYLEKAYEKIKLSMIATTASATLIVILKLLNT